MKKSAIRNLGILAAYALLALLFTWPLVLHFTTHVPGDGSDDPALAWNLWWVKYALLDLHVNPLQTDFMFYPIGLNLAYFTITLLNGLAAIPLQALFGLIATNNIIVIASFALSGYGMYLLALYILEKNGKQVDEETSKQGTVPHLAAFLAGVVFAFAPGKFLFAGFGQVNVLSTAWIPFYVLYLLKMSVGSGDPTGASGRLKITSPTLLAADCQIRRPRQVQVGNLPYRVAVFISRCVSGKREAILAGIFLLLNALSEYTYASFLLILTGFYLVYLWFTDRRAVWNWRMARNLAVIGGIFVAGFSPFLYEMVKEILIEGDYMMAGWGFADVFSADLLGFFTPSVLHPLFGEWASTFPFTYTNFATIGYTTLALGLLAVWSGKWQAASIQEITQRDVSAALPPPSSVLSSIRFWLYSALAFFLLMLGPVLHINGRYIFDLDGLAVRFPLPFILLHYVPLIKGNRYPSRYEVMLMLCLAVLVAWGAAWLLTQVARTAETQRARRFPALVFVLILALISFESLSVPLPLSNLTVPPIYQQIAQEPGDFTVLELPLGWRNGFRVSGAQHKVIMYQQFYQTTSQKRLLGGNTSRNPEFKFDYFVQAPLIRSFIALEEKRPLPPNAQEQDMRIAQEVLRFFDVRYVIVHPPYTGTDLEKYAKTVLPLERIYDQDGIRAYRVTLPPPAATLTVSLAGDLGRLYRGEGWSEPEASYRWAQRQEARLFLPLQAGQGYGLTLRALAPGPGQRVSLRLNGQAVGTVAMAEGWQELTFGLPAERVRDGLNELTLAYERAFPLLPGQIIGQTGVRSPVNIVARSAGQEAGDYGHIYVNGREAAANRRGYNVAVIHPQTGAVEQTGSFDTFESAAESSRLAVFLNRVPAGYIVAVAVRDEASLQLQADARDALASIGATVDLRGKFRWGQAVIGVKGAASGAALELAGRDEPLQVYVGRNVTTGEVGLAVERVTATPIR